MDSVSYPKRPNMVGYDRCVICHAELNLAGTSTVSMDDKYKLDGLKVKINDIINKAKIYEDNGIEEANVKQLLNIADRLKGRYKELTHKLGQPICDYCKYKFHMIGSDPVKPVEFSEESLLTEPFTSGLYENINESLIPLMTNNTSVLNPSIDSVQPYSDDGDEFLKNTNIDTEVPITSRAPSIMKALEPFSSSTHHRKVWNIYEPNASTTTLTPHSTRNNIFRNDDSIDDSDDDEQSIYKTTSEIKIRSPAMIGPIAQSYMSLSSEVTVDANFGDCYLHYINNDSEVKSTATTEEFVDTDNSDGASHEPKAVCKVKECHQGCETNNDDAIVKSGSQLQINANMHSKRCLTYNPELKDRSNTEVDEVLDQSTS